MLDILLAFSEWIGLTQRKLHVIMCELMQVYSSVSTFLFYDLLLYSLHFSRIKKNVCKQYLMFQIDIVVLQKASKNEFLV